MMKIMMLLNKKGDVEEIEFAGKYGKVFESIHDFLDPEPAEWTKVEKEADGYDKIIDKTIQALNEAKEKKNTKNALLHLSMLYTLSWNITKSR